MAVRDLWIEQLAALVRHHRNLYYNKQPEISDEEFEALEDRLRELDSDHPVLGEIGAAPEGRVLLAPATPHERTVPRSPEVEALAKSLLAQSACFYEQPDLVEQPAYPSLVQQYGATWEGLRELAPDHPAFGWVVPAAGHDWTKARHEIPMGSFNRVSTPNELGEWCERCDALAQAASLPAIRDDLAMTEKVDGLALELVYQNGELEAALTRGDGTIGEIISANVSRMQGVPARIAHPARLSVRGEVVVLKHDVPKVEKILRRIDKDFDGRKNLRNTAARLARAKEPRYLPACRYLTMLFYDVAPTDGLQTEQRKRELLGKLGFKTPGIFFGDSQELIRRWGDYDKQRRQQSDYEIDGLVVRANDLHTQTVLGELNSRPRAAVAFKFSSETRVTTLLGIEWRPDDSGQPTPIAQLEKVFLAGAEVTQASLHRLTNVQRLGLGVGDQVLVSRQASAIPYVQRVVVKVGQEAAPAPGCR